MKYLVEISENQFQSHIDDDNEYVYCTIKDLDNDIFNIIDCDDIVNWKPIGSTEFINKYNKNFLEND